MVRALLLLLSGSSFPRRGQRCRVTLHSEENPSKTTVGEGEKKATEVMTAAVAAVELSVLPRGRISIFLRQPTNPPLLLVGMADVVSGKIWWPLPFCGTSTHLDEAFLSFRPKKCTRACRNSLRVILHHSPPCFSPSPPSTLPAPRSPPFEHFWSVRLSP